MSEEFDAIVIGAGPAGSATSLAMAKMGLNVMLVERGNYPGEKNASGGILYGDILRRLVPRYWEEAPIERIVTTHKISVLSGKSSMSIDFNIDDFGKEPYNGVTVLRRKFDEWFANKAEDAGVLLVKGIRVDGLTRDGERITGIRAGDDEILADVVIAADGANSQIAVDAGLRNGQKPNRTAIGIKEVIELPKDVIQERFQLRGNEGLSHTFVGNGMKIPGGGFLYTNQDSLSIGYVAYLSSFLDGKIEARKLMDDFKEHPQLEKAVRGGKVVEYSAHLIPEGGYNEIGPLYTDGLLLVGDAAGLVLNTGYSYEGMNYAIASGIAAAKTVIRAKHKGRFDRKTLKHYHKILEDSFVLPSLKAFRRMPDVMHNPRIYSDYAHLINKIGREMFSSGIKPRDKLMPMIMRESMRSLSIFNLAVDALRMVRAI